MPRGNDAQAALQELADKFGKGVGNAEQLIEANLAMRSVRLAKAEQLPRDDAATAKAHEDLVGKKAGPNGEVVVDAAVRRAQSGGDPITVIVYQADDGRQHLGTLDAKGKAEDPADSPVVKAKAEEKPSTSATK